MRNYNGFNEKFIEIQYLPSKRASSSNQIKLIIYDELTG